MQSCSAGTRGTGRVECRAGGNKETWGGDNGQTQSGWAGGTPRSKAKELE